MQARREQAVSGHRGLNLDGGLQQARCKCQGARVQRGFVGKGQPSQAGTGEETEALSQPGPQI